MELSSREILDKLIKGEVVKLYFADQDHLNKFTQNLNTMKSRDKKVYTDLGLSWQNKILKFDILKEDSASIAVSISMCDQKIRKYKVFHVT